MEEIMDCIVAIKESTGLRGSNSYTKELFEQLEDLCILFEDELQEEFECYEEDE